MKDQTPRTEHRSHLCRGLAGLLILAVASLRLVYLLYFCPYDLAPDEAHYWDWSRQLDWSYYSKGPLVAWIIRASCEVFGPWTVGIEGTLMPAVRLPAVLFGAGLLSGLYVLTWQTYRSDRLALSTLVCALTFPPLSAVSLVMTIDSPLLCFWIWALVFGRWALVEGRPWAWPAAGTVVALGILAKYTMVLWLVSVGLFILVSPAHRRRLLRPGFWVMVAVAGLSAVPVVYWNSQHDWATFRHVAVQAGVDSSSEIGVRWFGPFEFLGGQFALLLGFWFVAWTLALVRFRPCMGASPELAYLWWLSVPTFVVFAASSFRASGQLNWPAAAYLSGAVLMTGWLAESLNCNPTFRRRALRSALTLTLAMGAILSVLIHNTRLFTAPLVQIAPSWLLPSDTADRTPARSFDLAARLKGGRCLGRELDRLRVEIVRVEGIEPVLAGTRWDLPGLIGFYMDGQPQACSIGLGLGADRRSQYDLWRPNPVDDPDAFRNRTFLVVSAWDPSDVLSEAFDSVSAPEEVVYRENGRAVQRWYVCICRGLRGFDTTRLQGRPVRH